jgi:Family of unknown function (DUF5694)
LHSSQALASFLKGTAKMKIGLALVCLGFLVAGCRTAPPVSVASNVYRPAVDFSAWRGAIAGPTTQVAVLGSTHLGQRDGTFDARTLEPLLAKLAAFNPTIITHEGLSGEQCELVQRYDKIYPEIYADYCKSYSKAIQASTIPLVQARVEAEVLLKTWPTAPTSSQRRRLAVLFLASGDQPSARVQWLQLPASERVKLDGITDGMLALLNRDGAGPNETDDIGVVLAARLGLPRIYAVDDHTSDAIQASAPDGLEAAIQAHWSSADPAKFPALVTMKAMDAGMTTGEGVLAAYRFYNAPETQRAFVELDFKGALALQSPQLFGRQYVAWYETRNLRMVANIRSAFGNSPGARVLNIVGASHKAYYEAYLAQMAEVELVDMEAILK